MASVGEIEYTIGVDTGQLIKAEKIVTNSMGKVDTAFRKSEVVTKGFGTATTKTAAAVKTGMAGMSRSVGQVGIQIQQLVGQIQGGQNAMQAFAAQAADIGIVTGFALTGVVVAFAAAIGSALLPSLLQGTNAMADLDAIAEKLGETLANAGDGSKILTDRIIKLAERSEALAKLKISEGIVESQKQIDVAAKEIQNVLNESSSVTAEFYDLIFGDQGAGRAGGKILAEAEIKATLKSLQEEFGVSESTAKEFALAVSQVKTEPTALAIKGLENSLSDLNIETGGSNKKVIELASQLLPLFDAVTNGVNSSNLLRTAFSDLGTAIDETKEKAGDSVSSTDSLSSSLEAQIIAYQEGEKAAFEYGVAQQLGLEIGEQIPESIQAQIDKIFELKDAQQQAAEARKEQLQAERDAQQKMNEAQREAAREASRNAAEQRRYISLVSDELARGVIEGGNFNEILSNLAKTIATQLLSSLIQLGIQSAIGQSAALATNTATATALGAAYATPAALASLASFGANAAPAQAGIATTLATTQGLSIAGGRQEGGPVSSTGTFRMGENNQPEILQTGAGLFGVPGDQGRVFNQSQLDQIDSGSNVSVNVIVENNAPSARVSTSTEDQGRTVRIAVNEVARQISEGQGPVANSLRQSTTTQMRGDR